MDILIVVTPNFNLAATIGFIDPFRIANYLNGYPLFSWHVASLQGGLCQASNGLAIETEPLSLNIKQRFKFVIVSSSWAPETYNTDTLKSALRKWSRQGSTIGTIDTGAFILAESGILDGKTATVHYEHIDAMRELYPKTHVSEALLVFDENLISCAGGCGSTDFALHIIKGVLGEALASNTAKYMFHHKVRPPETPQNPDTTEPFGHTTPKVVKQAIKVMEQHLESVISIPEVCRQINISQRQLGRLFSMYVKKTPALYYRDIRLDRARGLITQTNLPLLEIAMASGFSSQVHFSRAYKERFGLPPKKDRIEGRIPFEYRSWPMHKRKQPKPV